MPQVYARNITIYDSVAVSNNNNIINNN